MEPIGVPRPRHPVLPQDTNAKRRTPATVAAVFHVEHSTCSSRHVEKPHGSFGVPSLRATSDLVRRPLPLAFQARDRSPAPTGRRPAEGRRQGTSGPDPDPARPMAVWLQGSCRTSIWRTRREGTRSTPQPRLYARTADISPSVPRGTTAALRGSLRRIPGAWAPSNRIPGSLPDRRQPFGGFTSSASQPRETLPPPLPSPLPATAVVEPVPGNAAPADREATSREGTPVALLRQCPAAHRLRRGRSVLQPERPGSLYLG
jgi:hypothetical protein